MERLSYEDVSGEINSAIHEEVRKMGYTCIFISRKSDHPDDRHLYLVLAKKADSTYTVWSYNSDVRSLNGGAYGLTKAAALKDMGDRTYSY